MKERLNRLVKLVFLPDDDDNLRRKKTALTLLPLIIGSLAVVWGSIYFALGHPLSGAITMCYAVLSALGLGYFFKTKRVALHQFSQLLMALVLPFLMMWSLGGFAAGSMVMIWSFFAPITALMFLDKRAAFGWFLAFLAMVLVATLIDDTVAAAIPPLPHLAIHIFYVLNLGIGLAGLYLLLSLSIGEEKRAFERLKVERQRLELARNHAKELNHMLHTVLDSIPMRIFWKDRRLAYVGCNQLFARDAGKTSPQEVIGASDHDMCWHEEADTYRDHDAQIMYTGVPRVNSEEQQLLGDGSIIWVRKSKVPLRGSGGDVIGVLGIYDDITDEKVVAAALVAAKDAAETANRAKSEFLASMSHELRTPLNAILGFSQLLEINASLATETRDEAHEIVRAGKHMLALVNDLIDLARIEAGKVDFNMTPVLLKPLLKDTLNMAAPLALKLDIDLGDVDCRCNVDAVFILADELRLRQVIINLISNAIKYNRPHGAVRLSCDMNEGVIRINVTDTGPGIPADKRDRVFSAFDRLGREAGSVVGTGIGLVITKRLTEAMGGRTGFTSIEGSGSRFWVEFPVRENSDWASVALRQGTNAG